MMIKGYKELLAEIEIHNNLLDAHRTSYKYYQKIADNWQPREMGAMSYSSMPKGGSIDLDPSIVMSKAIAFYNMIQEEKEILDQLMVSKQLIEKALNETNIKVKVGMLRAMGITQQQVAELIGYSERQVQRVEKKINE